MDYQKLDNWDDAKKIFGKIIGKTDYEKVNKKLKLFADLDKLIAASDKASEKAVKVCKKDKMAIIPQEAIDTLRGNNSKIAAAKPTLVKLLDDNLDDKYDEAIEQLVAELDLYQSVYASFTNLTMNGKKEDLTALQDRLNQTSKFLQPGSFEKAFGKGNEAFQVVARKLQEFAEKKDKATDQDIEDLYATYNKSLPNNGNGVRVVTTFLKSFVDLEIYFEKYSISESNFKKLKLHPEIKDYATFRNYLKGSAVFIRKLTPWATAKDNTLEKDYVDNKKKEGNAAIAKDIAARITEGKRALIQAKTFFIKLF